MEGVVGDLHDLLPDHEGGGGGGRGDIANMDYLPRGNDRKIVDEGARLVQSLRAHPGAAGL